MDKREMDVIVDRIINWSYDPQERRRRPNNYDYNLIKNEVNRRLGYSKRSYY
jgi:hypothetical protein